MTDTPITKEEIEDAIWNHIKLDSGDRTGMMEKKLFRRICDAALKGVEPSKQDGWKPTHRHKRREIGLVRVLQDYAVMLPDGGYVVVFQGRDERVWVMDHEEFHDVQFEQLVPPPSKQEVAGSGEYIPTWATDPKVAFQRGFEACREMVRAECRGSRGPEIEDWQTGYNVACDDIENKVERLTPNPDTDVEHEPEGGEEAKRIKAIIQAIRKTPRTPRLEASHQAADLIESLQKERDDLQERYDREYATVDRIWKALCIETYEQANGLEISEIVARIKADKEKLAAALKPFADKIKTTTYSHPNALLSFPYRHCEAARAALAETGA